MTAKNKEESPSQPVSGYITEILRPLESTESESNHRNTPTDYQRQERDPLQMEKRFRGTESLFADAYSQVSGLEKAIAGYREKWQNSAPSS